MLYIFQNTEYIENYKEFDRIDKLWGGYGIPTSFPPISTAPLQKLLSRWAGVENTINMYMYDIDEFEDIIKMMESTENKDFF